MKWLLTIAMAVMLVGCSASSTLASQLANDGTTRSVETQSLVAPKAEIETLSLQKIAREQQAEANKVGIKKVVAKLLSRVGRTPYVFSGSSIYGWDCSGMVVWAYEQLGVELEHSATKQAQAGERVKTPEVGDIVVFGWKGRKDYFHSAIYIGNGKVVNANRGFGGTHIQDISEFGTKRVVYVRVLETQ
jgi:cell wall-associated NlpC family hydrolase